MENEIDNGGKADVFGEPVGALNFFSRFRTYAVPWVGGNGVCHGGNDFLPRFISLATKRTVRLFKKLRKAIRPLYLWMLFSLLEIRWLGHARSRSFSQIIYSRMRYRIVQVSRFCFSFN